MDMASSKGLLLDFSDAIQVPPATAVIDERRSYESPGKVSDWRDLKQLGVIHAKVNQNAFCSCRQHNSLISTLIFEIVSEVADG